MAGTPSDITAELVAWHRDARRRTLELVAALDDRQLMGPRLAIVNPMRWEVGHVAWFQEFWALRYARGESPIRADADSLYDSIKVAHDARWDLPLPSMADTLAYAEMVLDRVLGRLGSREPTAREIYFHRLAVFHEDMHDEAFAYTRQTLAYPRPELGAAHGATVRSPGVARGDAELPGGRFQLGASEALPFVFDNEKWAHAVDLRPFRIARAPVTNAEFAEFVASGSYRERRFWSEEGWSWREATRAERPAYWRESGDGQWQQRAFEDWLPLELEHPVVHVSWHEANAYCRWRGRRLPSEAEWEMTAAFDPDVSDGHPRVYPWGDEAPTSQRANLDGTELGPIGVGALPEGDSACGCRQLLGNVWEWTASDFLPYPGFVIDPYKEYSEPWFGTHKVLRGGSWTTPGRLLRNTWRNFYTADRRDVFAGFRTCADL